MKAPLGADPLSFCPDIETMQILPRDFYNRDADQVARGLLGMWLVHRHDQGTRTARIVETEAYLGPQDLACHTSRGKTARNAVMFGPPGHAYIYMIYGMYHCLNAVTGPEDHGAAVLIRALEPIQGIEGNTRGPGRLCRALGIDRRLNGIDLTSGELILASPTESVTLRIVARPRIGVAYARSWADAPLRFCVEGSAFLSRP